MFYSRTEKMSQDEQGLLKTVMDIEDLGKIGRQHRFCPFYMAKHLKNRSDIIFMPYNYLLQPRTWRALGKKFSKKSNSYTLLFVL